MPGFQVSIRDQDSCPLLVETLEDDDRDTTLGLPLIVLVERELCRYVPK
jgi:hypothetical protein